MNYEKEFNLTLTVGEFIYLMSAVGHATDFDIKQYAGQSYGVTPHELPCGTHVYNIMHEIYQNNLNGKEKRYEF